VTDADPSQIAFPGASGRTPQPDESFLMLAAPELIVSGGTQALQPTDLDPAPPPGTPSLSGTLLWSVQDHDGSTLTIQAPAGSIELQPARKDDDLLSEVCTIVKGADGVVTDLDHTTLTLTLPLANSYDRATVTVNANVAPATHGTTVAEIGGSGDAGQVDQSFTLKQSPLTYVSSATDPSGRVSTLVAQVNGVKWHESATLYGAGPKDRVYTLRQDDDGNTTVAFGDGINGARLPSAQNNVRFTYRQGTGTVGNLRSSQLSMLLTRPLGVKSATNPTPATGGQDPEILDDARHNAPLRVLTLDRAVSIDDYADYSRTFAGIAKAYAIWIDDARARGVYVTVGGPDGERFPAGSDTLIHLSEALRNYGDALLPLSVQSYIDATFTLQASIKIDPDSDNDAVLAAVTSALRAAYSFDARDFGQSVTIDEVYAVIQNVAGVIACDINQLYRLDTGPTLPQPAPRLLATLPTVQSDGSVNAADLLTLDPGPIDLGVMP
jgi:predicted phage baseplate assembly protein